MNKTINLHFYLVLLVSATAFILSSCGVAMSTSMLTPRAQTIASQYIHYTPPKKFNIDLEFDYPGDWVLRDGVRETGIRDISLGDPRFLTLPTLSPTDFDPTPNDFGGIVIWVQSTKPGHTPDSEVESLKQGYKDDFRIKLLKDYGIKIGGYDARVLEYQKEPAPDDYPSVMFSRRIYFIVKDQIYQIYFTVAEKERGSEFEKGYEYFFRSLKIIP